MNAFFWKLIHILGKISIFKNFAKPISKNTAPFIEEEQQSVATISYQNLEIVRQSESVIISEAYNDSAICGAGESVHQEAVAVLPAVICVSDSHLLNAPIQNPPEFTPSFSSYDIQNTPVSNFKEETVSIPIRIIESADGAPTKHRPLSTRKTVRRTNPAKSVEGIKKVSKKAKPKAKKKDPAPVPPEATGFGFRKIDNKKAK